MKKTLTIIVVAIICLLIGGTISYFIFNDTTGNLKSLPKAELTGGTRGDLGIDKNINEETIDNYLNRSDSVYRDMRFLEDVANWEVTGGTSNLTGFIDGFEVVSYPYLTSFTEDYLKRVQNLGIENLYNGKTLFTSKSDGTYTANYEESLSILEDLFPKDKYIFLICGAGGYAGKTKELLVALGWDKDKIYNIGGYWYYNGKNNVEVYDKESDTYAFWKVPYHNIDFSLLHEVN